MINEKDHEQLYLVKSLIKLLRRLKFSDIRVRYHPEYPDPEIVLSDGSDNGYAPVARARKNDVVYYFELVGDQLPDSEEIKHPLQMIIERSDIRWDTDFVLVTPYGNKDTVKEWCQKNNLEVTHIWEV